MRILASATVVLRRIVDLGLVALIAVVLGGLILGKGAPLIGARSIIVGGGSMEPTIHVGSAILIRPVDPAALTVGDVVSMQVGAEGTTYTHRVVAVIDRADGRWIRTQGDANASPDPTLVPASAVLGRVDLAIPFAGYLLALLSLPVGMMFVLGMAATLLSVACLLESLEPDALPASAHASPGAEGGDPSLRGEPIAARPSAARAAAGRAGWLGWFMRRGRSVRQAGQSSVRAQLDRSRDQRRRRARWLSGRSDDRPTSG